MTNQLLLKLSLLLLLLHGTDTKMEIITKRDVELGESVTLLCKAGGEGEITWNKDDESIDEEKVLKPDESSSKLILQKATMEDAGTYTCMCAFDDGRRDDEVSIQLYIHEGPSFGSTKTYHEFLEGNVGVVPCLASGKPKVNVQWLRNNKTFNFGEGQRVHQQPDNTLHIGEVSREDAGTYICQAQIKDRPIFKQLPISVVVNAPPKVHLREEVTKVMAGSKTNVSLLCLVDGAPKPNITWTLPVDLDPSRHQFNSDRSELTILSVARGDYGEYLCTAANKIAEDSATIMLHVLEPPEVFLSAKQQSVVFGEQVSVSCNVSGHPQPELHWLNKQNGHTLDSKSGHIHVVDGMLVIDGMLPTDGGVYSCMAVGPSGNASRDVNILTQPGPPHYMSVSPGPTSVQFDIQNPPISGGTPVTSYVLQWRRSAAEPWMELTVPASDPLVVNTLRPYTVYTVRLAALNAVGVGQFSNTNNVRTQGMREPDKPVLSSDEIKIKENTFSIPLKQSDDGGTPVLHFTIRFKQDKEGAKWTEKNLPASAESVSLLDLSFASNYQLEVTAVNANGSSLPSTFNFTIAEQPRSSLTKGGVVGIVMLIFLVVFLVVDASCCYTNRCGLLMSIAVRLCGQKVPGLKMIEEGGGGTNGEVKLKGISTPRGSLQQGGVQTLTRDGTQSTEVTCDKAPLTKHEKTQPDRDLSTTIA